MRCFHCMNSIPDGAALCPCCNEAPSKENPPYCLTAGTVLKNKYIIGNVIGEGGFGITYAGWDTALGQKIAVKEYYPSICANRSHTGDNQVIPGQASKGQYFRMGKERFTQEAQSAAQFSGEAGIVKILDYFEENDTAYIVMNYVEGGNLGEIVRSRGKLEPKTFFAVMLPLMRTLEHVHQTGMIHRDIAPDNIIMSQDGSLTLLDFGSARYYFGEETKSLSVVLKPGYAPYEQYSRKGNQGAWTDVYALCATIYKCITGETPPDALDRAINDELKKPSELGVRLPAAVETALMKGLAVFPKDRLQTVGELRKAIEKGYPAEKAVDVKPEKEKKKPKRKIMIAAIAVVLACMVAAVSVFVVVPNVQKSTNSSQQEETQQSETQQSETQLQQEETQQSETQPQQAKKLNLPRQPKTTTISAGYGYTLGLKSDGTVATAGEEPLDWNIDDDVYSTANDWTDIIAISAGFSHCVGLISDGTVVVSGLDKEHELQFNADHWSNIVAVSAGNSHTVGLKTDGTVITTGENDFGQCDVSGWSDIIAVSASDYHTVGLNTNGTVVATGDNRFGQCNVNGWSDIVVISASNNHTVGLKSDGTVIATGNNSFEQCSMNDWYNIIAVSAGSFHTVGLKSDGTVVAIGYNDFGQCNVNDWTDIVAICAGDNRTVGLKSDGTVVAVGDNTFHQCDVSGWKDIKLPEPITTKSSH